MDDQVQGHGAVDMNSKQKFELMENEDTNNNIDEAFPNDDFGSSSIRVNKEIKSKVRDPEPLHSESNDLTDANAVESMIVESDRTVEVVSKWENSDTCSNSVTETGNRTMQRSQDLVKEKINRSAEVMYSSQNQLDGDSHGLELHSTIQSNLTIDLDERNVSDQSTLEAIELDVHKNELHEGLPPLSDILEGDDTSEVSLEMKSEYPIEEGDSCHTDKSDAVGIECNNQTQISRALNSESNQPDNVKTSTNTKKRWSGRSAENASFIDDNAHSEVQLDIMSSHPDPGAEESNSKNDNGVQTDFKQFPTPTGTHRSHDDITTEPSTDEGSSKMQSKPYSKEQRDLQIARDFYNQGIQHTKAMELDKALRCHDKALFIRKRVHAQKEHFDIAISYDSIGMIYFLRDELDQSIEYCLESLSIKRNVLGHEHPSIANSCNNVGLIHDQLGQYDTAFNFHTKALLMRENLLEKHHRDTIASYDNIGVVLMKKRAYLQATEFFLQAFASQQEVLGEHPETARSCDSIAEAHYGYGDYETAIEYCRKGLKMRESLYGKNHPQTLSSYHNISMIMEGINILSHLASGETPKKRWGTNEFDKIQ